MLSRAFHELLRREGGRILAGLIRRFGDFGLAEDALQDACAKALETWPRDGMPANPAAWLTRVAQHRALDMLRRHSRQVPDGEALLATLADESAAPDAEREFLEDDRLRLIFTCCHPSLNGAAQAALALRTLCGLTTLEIARAFHEPEATVAQRIVRAKRKIADARIPYAVPGPDELPARLDIVLRVVYLLFNEGYAATTGTALLRIDLCAEAIRLARLVTQLLPEQEEAEGLLALLLLQHARSAARTDARGLPVTLDRQDRALWDRGMIAEGLAVLDAAIARRRPGPYQLQAAIAALHARAARAADTDWPQIAALYERLHALTPSPVVALNGAVALAMAGDVAEGLRRIAAIEAAGELARSHYLYAAKADLLRRAGQEDAALAAFDRAWLLAANDAERRFLARRRGESAQRQDGDA